MSKFFVTGGQQRQGADGQDEWFSYAEALVLEVDISDGSAAVRTHYVTPPEARPEDPRSNIVFKAGSIHDGKLLVCTQTEILAFSLPDFQQVGYVSHPWFNDLHHVCLNGRGHYLVAVTGLDLILEMTPAGEVVQEWPVHEGDTWDRFDRTEDYRKVLTTKPHNAHPNYVFEHAGEVWATRLNQKDAVCVSGGSGRVEVGVQKVHDGHVQAGVIHFTTVDGRVVKGDMATGKVISIHDLNAMTPTTKSLGWCRGLHLLADDKIIIGFSRLRPSRIKENLTWVKYKLGIKEKSGMMPTRLACYDLAHDRLDWDLDLEPHGLNAVFSILPAD